MTLASRCTLIGCFKWLFLTNHRVLFQRSMAITFLKMFITSAPPVILNLISTNHRVLFQRGMAITFLKMFITSAPPVIVNLISTHFVPKSRLVFPPNLPRNLSPQIRVKLDPNFAADGPIHSAKIWRARTLEISLFKFTFFLSNLNFWFDRFILHTYLPTYIPIY